MIWLVEDYIKYICIAECERVWHQIFCDHLSDQYQISQTKCSSNFTHVNVITEYIDTFQIYLTSESYKLRATPQKLFRKKVSSRNVEDKNLIYNIRNMVKDVL